MLSVIIPVYNRSTNILVCLRALAAQKGVKGEFEVLIVDDGSTDDTLDVISKEYSNMRLRKDAPLTILSGGPNKGFRGGRARNIAAFNCAGDRMMFVDSDVALNQNSIKSLLDAAAVQPDAIIVGLYHWLPPLDWSLGETALHEAVSFVDLMGRVAEGAAKVLSNVVNDSPFGEDIRTGDFDDSLSIKKGCGLGALSGNISYPKNLFWRLGGFDERIVGHGGEDADLGLTADEANADWILLSTMFGFHVWHTRNQLQNSKEVQANIAFIDAKHGIGKYAGAKKWTDSQDWADPIHYHKHLGSHVVKPIGSETVYACREGRCIGIPTHMWLIQLGFDWEDVDMVDADYLKGFIYSGAIADYSSVKEKEEEAKAEPEFDVMNISSYKKQEGAFVAREPDNMTVYVCRGKTRMALNHHEWLTWLGFTADDVSVVPREAFADYTDIGVSPDRSKVYTGELDV